MKLPRPLMRIRSALVLALLPIVLTGWGQAESSAAATSSLPYVAVLANGFSIPHHHREKHGATTRLFLSSGSDNYVDVATSSILEIEKPQLAVASVTPAEATNAMPPSLEDSIAEASDHQGVDADLIRSVISAESGFRAAAVSPKGAQGLMQLMPATALDLGLEDPFDPQANIDAGTRYLRALLLSYHGDLMQALAAYNAGPERVSEYQGVPPFPETRAYVAKVIREFNRKKQQQQLRASRHRKANQSGISSPRQRASASLSGD